MCVYIYVYLHNTYIYLHNMIVDNNDWCCCPSHSSNFLFLFGISCLFHHIQLISFLTAMLWQCSKMLWGLLVKFFMYEIMTAQYIYICTLYIIFTYLFSCHQYLYFHMCEHHHFMSGNLPICPTLYLPHVCRSLLERPKASLFWQFRWGHLVMRTLFGVKCFFSPTTFRILPVIKGSNLKSPN